MQLREALESTELIHLFLEHSQMSLEQIINTAHELIPSDLLNDFLKNFYKSSSESNLKNAQRNLLKILAYEISLGCNNENIDKSIEILDMIVSYDNSLKEVIRASIKNNSFPSKYNIKLYEHFNESFNINFLEHHVKNNLSETIFDYESEKLSEKLSEKELIELLKIFIEDDIEEFIKASANDNKESALKSIRCAIRCEAIEIFKYIISRFPIDSFDNAVIAKYIAHPMIEVGNISMLQYLFDSKFQFLEYMNADLNNCQHYKFIEIFKSHYETESVVALRCTVSMIYSKLYNIKLYSLI